MLGACFGLQLNLQRFVQRPHRVGERPARDEIHAAYTNHLVHVPSK